MTPSPEKQTAQADHRPKRRVTSWRVLLPFLLLLTALPIGLAQSWMAHARRCVAYDLTTLDERTALVRDELSQAHIQVEGLRSPTRADTVAEELGLVRAESPPVVVAAGASDLVAEAFAEPTTDPQDAPIMVASYASVASFWPFDAVAGRQSK
ncbi:hypothetical protein HN371_01425 [Candidatus Poribacteria bacterium]|nr:hypothetical protein [Candidatus Poribacteria bacterium]MBT5712993.1 hypothetical protein [Candidatus Poribacteria bacterium]MBT7806374.1 hypothetical protein [Candidatus Poribacteria bacterium]